MFFQLWNLNQTVVQMSDNSESTPTALQNIFDHDIWASQYLRSLVHERDLRKACDQTEFVEMLFRKKTSNLILEWLGGGETLCKELSIALLRCRNYRRLVQVSDRFDKTIEPVRF